MSAFLPPTMRIGDIVFSILRKWNGSGRQLVNIHSRNIYTDETRHLWVYASISELGLWRLCVHYTNDLLYKGVDYAQSSLIHIDLQRFINEHLERIPEVELTPQQIKDECVCSEENNFRAINKTGKTTACDENIRALVETLDDNGRILNIHKFKNFEKCGRKLTKSDIEHISNTVEELYDCGDNLTKLHQHSYVFIHSGETGTSNVNVTGDIYRVSLISKHRNLKEMTEEYKKKVIRLEKNLKDNTEMATKYHMESIYANLIKTLENSIQDILDLHKPVPDIDLYFFAGNLGNLSIESEDTSVGLLSSVYQNLHTVCGKPLHIFPFLLTPKDSMITEFGIYTKYVPAGAFICKLFDYHKQCVDIEGNVEEGVIKCTPSYSYIGDRYLRMFPYNQLIEQINAQTVCDIQEPMVLESSSFPRSPSRPPSRSVTKKKALKASSSVKPSRKHTTTRKSSRLKKKNVRGGRKTRRSRKNL